MFLYALLLLGACLRTVRRHSGLSWPGYCRRELVRRAVRAVRGATGARRLEPMYPAVSASRFYLGTGTFGACPLFWWAPRWATAFALRPQALPPGARVIGQFRMIPVLPRGVLTFQKVQQLLPANFLARCFH